MSTEIDKHPEKLWLEILDAYLAQGRDVIGHQVRLAWIDWARSQPNPKPSWLVDYWELSEPDREADRQIGERIARHFVERARQVIIKATGLSPMERSNLVLGIAPAAQALQSARQQGLEQGRRAGMEEAAKIAQRTADHEEQARLHAVEIKSDEASYRLWTRQTADGIAAAILAAAEEK